MSKKDISKILTTGSTKQRLLLIAEDNARATYGKERILTDHEYSQISESFKTPKDIKLWNKWLQYSRTISNAIPNLQGLKFEVLMHYSNLRGYILVWNSIENAELLVNSVLHEIKDTKERKRIAEKGTKGIDILFSKTSPDQEGYIDIKIDFEEDSYLDENGKLMRYEEKPRKTKEYTLLYVMNNVKQEASISAVKFLSWREAVLDYMEETGFNVKTYKDIIGDLTQDIFNPIIGWFKYQSDMKEFIPGYPSKRLDTLKSKYSITPNIAELEVDQEIYQWFKTNILGDE